MPGPQGTTCSIPKASTTDRPEMAAPATKIISATSEDPSVFAYEVDAIPDPNEHQLAALYGGDAHASGHRGDRGCLAALRTLILGPEWPAGAFEQPLGSKFKSTPRGD